MGMGGKEMSDLTRFFRGIPDEGLFKRAVALGRVTGWRALRKFGRNDDVDGTEEMWEYGTSRVLPVTAATLSVVSSSSQDTNTTGTGAWTITVEGLDADYEELTETITMNGTSPVSSTGVFFRVNRAYVLTGGTGDTNVGNIDISINAAEQAFIEADEGQTHQTHYTVPAGHTVLVTGLTVVTGTLGGSSSLVVESQIKLLGGMWRAISAVDLTDGQTYQSRNTIGTVIPEKTEIRQKLILSGANGNVAGIFNGYLINNDEL